MVTEEELLMLKTDRDVSSKNDLHDAIMRVHRINAFCSDNGLNISVREGRTTTRNEYTHRVQQLQNESTIEKKNC
jgi:hypothetical protein